MYILKKNVFIKCIVCMLVIIFCLTSCKDAKDLDPNAYILGINADKTGLYPIEYTIPDEGTTSENVQKVIDELSKPSDDIKYRPAIPENVGVNSIDLKGQILTIDFNSGYLELGNIQEKLTRAAVVQSIVKVSGIRGVIFTVEGKELFSKDNEYVGLMTDDDFVKNIGFSVSSYQEEPITLYFSNITGDKLVPVTQEFKYSTNTPKEKIIVEKLIKGSKRPGTKSTIGPRVDFLSVTTKDNICYVNFDDEFLTSPIDVKPEVVIYSIVNSIIEGTDAKEVQITVNGEKNIMYKDTIDLTQPFYANFELVEEQK